jgi:hypothetical protein
LPQPGFWTRRGCSAAARREHRYGRRDAQSGGALERSEAYGDLVLDGAGIGSGAVAFTQDADGGADVA